MELEEIYRKDLNLLIALQILIEESSVSKAAKRLNLSQSAMSRVLSRLRILLQDELFTRQGQTLIPTQRAFELAQAFHPSLEEIRQGLSPQNFDPKTCQQRFKIATTDYAMQTILPFALPRIYQEAPQIQLDLIPVQHEQLTEQLTSQGVDIAICRSSYHLPPLHNQTLGKVSVFCLLSPHHPLANKVLTLDDYLQAPHAIIAISDGVKALIDKALCEYPTPRQVLRAYHLEAALAIIDTLPLIITVPADLAYLVASKYNLVIKPLPFELAPFDYSLIWHARCQHSASQVWLREVLTQECGKLMEKRVKMMGIR